MAEKCFVTSLKSMEEAASFSIERIARFVNLSSDIVDCRYNLIKLFGEKYSYSPFCFAL
jgi:hypothetical protein